MCGVLLLRSAMLFWFVPEWNFLSVSCEFLLLGVTAGLLRCITSNYRHILMQWQLYWPHCFSRERPKHSFFTERVTPSNLVWEWGGSMSRHARSLSLALKMTVQLLAIVFNGLSTTQAEKPVVLYNRGRNSAYKREIKQTCHDFISLDLNESVNCWLFVYLCSVSVCLNMLLFIFSLIISCDSNGLMRAYSIHTH